MKRPPSPTRSTTLHSRLSAHAMTLQLTLLPGNLALADGLIVIEPPPRPIPLPPGHFVFAPLRVEYHHVTVTIKDQVAITEIDQVFVNPNDQRLEGQYIFPIPEGARIDKFSMDVNGKMVDAELLDAAKARKIYEDIVRSMKDPALLEYAGRGMFKARIFPIEPHSKKQVKLRYTQLLKQDSGVTSYTYPLNTEKFSAGAIESVSVKVELKCTKPIASIYSPSHTVEIKRHGENEAVVGFEAKNVKPDTDFQLYFATTKEKDDIGLSLLTYADDGANAQGGYFLLLASPAWKTKADAVVKKDVVLVIDTSGSMAGKKLEQAKKALDFVVANLNEGDRFEIIRFSTEAEPLFGELAANDKRNRDRAAMFVADLKPIGGTAIHDAVKYAAATLAKRSVNTRPGVVIFLTDGRPTIGNTDEDSIVAAAGQDPYRVFCFGIGSDVNTHLLDKIAEKTRGTPQYVLPDEDIEVKVSRFYEKISNPVLANLELSFTGDLRVKQLYPAPLPDLFQGDQLAILGRYSGGGDSAIVLTGMVNGEKRTITMEGSFAKSGGAEADLAFIPKLWATRRVGYLLDEIRLHGESAELREEVTQLARTYGIVTPYTAYLIVEDEAQRNVPMAGRTLQAPAQDARVQRELEGAYRQMGEAKSGDGAVAGSQSVNSLKSATTPAAPTTANESALRGLTGQSAADALATGGYKLDTDAGRAAQSVQQAQANARYVKGRTFYQNGSQWVDADVQKQSAQARRVRVTFNSEGYFELLAKHPEAAQWLALGRNVQVVLDGTIYDVVEAG